MLAACAENQATLNYRQSHFVKTLERLTYPGGRPNPDCGSYARLRREFRKDTPDVDRPGDDPGPKAAAAANIAGAGAGPKTVATGDNGGGDPGSKAAVIPGGGAPPL